jgi:hypothetical protein
MPSVASTPAWKGAPTRRCITSRPISAAISAAIATPAMIVTA